MKKVKLILTVVTIIFLLQNILFAQANLVTNGDFSTGNTGFLSMYTYCNTAGCMGACGCPPQYAVGSDANYYHSFLTGFDHTTGSGNFLIADGGVSAVIVWKQTIPVNPNTNYSFSFWLSSVYFSSPASMQVVINGVNVGSPFAAPGTVNTWIQCNSSWNSGSNISATIDIIDLNTAFIGNDFGLDDISFTKTCNSTNPFICEVFPKLNAIDVSKTSDVSVTFLQDMNASTINSSNIKVFGLQTGKLSSSITYNAGTRTATINPNSDFKVGEKIQVTLSSGIQTSTNTPTTPLTWTFTVQALSGTGVFTEASVIDSVNLNVGQPGVEIKSGDIDGDGDIDLLTIGYFTGIKVYKNNGSGNFSLSQQINNLAGVEHYEEFYTGDFDNDGDLDFTLAIATHTFFLDSLYTYKNDGTGLFTKSSATIGGGLGGTSADLDGDGDLDLGMSWGLDKARYYINDGNGNFVTHLIENLGYYHTNGCDLGDLDNDGDIDIFVSLKDFDNTHCKFISLLNNGNANFSFGTTYFTNQYFDDQKLVDINGDNNLDIVGRNYHYFSLGNDSFYQTTFPDSGSQAIPLDFDADGDIDLAYSNYPSNNVKFFKNNAAGSFVNSSNITLGQYTTGGATGDFDNDGDMDLAINNVFGHNGRSDISILKNNMAPQTCSITGSEVILPGSVNNIFVGSTPNGYWDISNYDITQASISPPSNGDTVRVSAGPYGGHFVLYFIIPDGHGGYPFCTKHIYVEDSTAVFCNITAIIEGFYDVNLNKLSISDTVRAYLRNTISPFFIVDSAKTVIDSTTFTGGFLFRNANSGAYYIVLKHRNGLETWSKGTLMVKGGVRNYDFTSSASQAYGNNLIQKGTKFCIYSGDVNHDGVTDLSDLSLIDNDITNFTSGYVTTDINGDGTVDISDVSIVDNNSYNFVSVRNPIVGDAHLRPRNENQNDKKILLKENETPKNFELKDNYPNPFNPTTRIKYELPNTSYVSLKVFDITGREVASLVNENQNAGRYSVEFNGSNLSSGIYFYKIVAGENVQVKRMILVK